MDSNKQFQDIIDTNRKEFYIRDCVDNLYKKIKIVSKKKIYKIIVKDKLKSKKFENFSLIANAIVQPLLHSYYKPMSDCLNFVGLSTRVSSPKGKLHFIDKQPLNFGLILYDKVGNVIYAKQ